MLGGEDRAGQQRERGHEEDDEQDRDRAVVGDELRQHQRCHADPGGHTDHSGEPAPCHAAMLPTPLAWGNAGFPQSDTRCTTRAKCSAVRRISGGISGRGWAAALLAVAVALAACSDGDGDGDGGSGEAVELEGDLAVDADRPGTCEGSRSDPLPAAVPEQRLHPPRPDHRDRTARRLPRGRAPRQRSGARIDPEEWNRSDGFSPLPTILVDAPGVDPVASGVPPVTDIGASLEDESAVVVLDADTGERVPVWGELDAHAPGGEALLIVHPRHAG